MTEQKSKKFKIGERINESIANSTFNSGFNFMIDFNDLYFSQKNDLIATGGYGEVYKGKWLGLPVAIEDLVDDVQLHLFGLHFNAGVSLRRL